ncbi:hypothetical protein HZS_2295 [Henneguya salminicola]|nr:hypothetical protein HZS_2295 [Henneguya salminicola]
MIKIFLAIEFQNLDIQNVRNLGYILAAIKVKKGRAKDKMSNKSRSNTDVMHKDFKITYA